jgi:amidase
LAKAREAENEVNRGIWRGSLHGVPIAVKDLCYTNYAPAMAGMFIHKDFIPLYTCTIVERLDRAGAVILGLGRLSSSHSPREDRPCSGQG